MKTLMILAVILGVAFLFFVAKAERSFVINGNEVTPAGIIGVPKALLDKASEIKSGMLNSAGISDNGEIGNIGPISTGSIITAAKNFISGTVDKVSETIKAPIEDKVNSILCPQK